MVEEFSFDKNDFEKYRKEQEKINTLIEKNTKSMGAFVSAHANALKLSKQLAYSQDKIKKDKKKLVDNEEEIVRLGSLINDNNKDEHDAINKSIKALKNQNKVLSGQIPYHQNLVNSYQKQLNLLQKSIKSWRAIGSVIKNEVGGALKNGWKTLNEYDKEVRKTQLSMGILSNQSQIFSQNIYKTAVQTQQMGANAKDLAIYQRDYSEQTGRALVLSEKGLIAMTEMAKGTMLGADGAAQLAYEMDNFGISASGARDVVQETVDSSHKMGVNAEKVSKNLLNSMRTAQKFHFKGGVKGISQMAINAAKFKIDMEEVAGFAEKLFTPEGAIDAAAQLQVLGGEWSKLADPFKLMYQARHDMQGLQEDMIKATAGAAKFNKETGHFDISGMELHRLREIAKVTGQDVGKLSEQAKNLARFNKIKMSIGGKVDPDIEEFITSTAEYDTKKGGYFIQIGMGDPINIKNLSELQKKELKNIVLQKELLRDRAIQSQSLDELWKNLKDTFKSALLPFLQGVQEGLRDPLTNFINWMKTSNVQKNMADFSSKIGMFATTILKFVAENPFKSVISAITGLSLFNLGKWYINGKMLGMGFNSTTMGSGMSNNGKVSPKGNFYNKRGYYNKSTGQYLGKGMNSTVGQGKGNSYYNKGGLTGAGKVGLGLGFGIGGLGLDMVRSNMNESDSGMGKALGIGSSALYGAGMGAMFGPLGMAIGGALGGLYGTYNELSKPVTPSNVGGNIHQDFVMRPGSKAEPFSSNDTLIGFKPGGPIEKSSKSNNTSDLSKIKIEFEPIKIEFGTLLLKNENSEIKLDLNNDPMLAREIASIVQQEIRKTIGGGKLNSTFI